MGGGEVTYWEFGLPSPQHSEGNWGVRGEGIGRNGVPDADGKGTKGVPEGVCQSVRDLQLPQSSSRWPVVGLQSAFWGLEVDKTIVVTDDFVHHHGLGYCPMVTKWLEVGQRLLKGSQTVPVYPMVGQTRSPEHAV